jgi:glutathione peroxidase
MPDSALYSFPVKTIDGEDTTLATYRGKTLVIVNVASQCGFTNQYAGLEVLYRKFKDRGLVVLGFPCNQFGGQEPGDESEIKRFCSLKYDVTFPLFAKVDVNGPDAHPLYDYLKRSESGILGTDAIKWNFTKFLVSKGGAVVSRFAPKLAPDAMEKHIVAIL